MAWATVAAMAAGRIGALAGGAAGRMISSSLHLSEGSAQFLVKASSKVVGAVAAAGTGLLCMDAIGATAGAGYAIAGDHVGDAGSTGLHFGSTISGYVSQGYPVGWSHDNPLDGFVFLEGPHAGQPVSKWDVRSA